MHPEGPPQYDWLAQTLPRTASTTQENRSSPKQTRHVFPPTNTRSLTECHQNYWRTILTSVFKYIWFQDPNSISVESFQLNSEEQPMEEPHFSHLTA